MKLSNKIKTGEPDTVDTVVSSINFVNKYLNLEANKIMHLRWLWRNYKNGEHWEVKIPYSGTAEGIRSRGRLRLSWMVS